MIESTEPGAVYLVGAGPGDTGLVTLRAQACIQAADVIVYDALSNNALLDWARDDCERVYVGKQASRHALPQDDIEAILVDRARKKNVVVRLKGGDPFIFGRGGEELEQLRQDGIAYEIVPGVTAALAAAAYVEAPLTHRDHSSAATFLTGHENPEKHDLSIDFRAFAGLGATHCVYMGMGQLARFVGELRAGGLPGETPALVVQWATLPCQRSARGTLETIEGRVAEAGLGAPGIIMVGDVVALAPERSWFESRPLFGRRVVVTRARDQAGDLTRRLEASGAEVIELPFIQIEPHYDRETVGEVMAGLAVYEWLVFTSVNGVRTFFDLFYRAYEDLRCLGPMRIAAVGKATAREIRAHKLKVDLVPSASDADTLASELVATENVEHVQILAVTGSRNRQDLVHKLHEQGQAIVDTLPLYKTSLGDLSEHPAAADFRERGADAILFTSTSTVKAYQHQQDALRLEEGAKQPACGSIGPVTSKALEDAGLPVAFQADEADLDAFVDATENHFAPPDATAS